MASKLEKYYLMNNRDDSNAPLIAATHGNLIVGKVWLFRDELDYLELKNTYKGWITGIPGYKIAITFHTTLTGKIQLDQTHTEHVLRILDEMGEFFTKERLEHKPGYYSKYRISAL